MPGPFELHEKPELGRDLAPDDLLLVSDTAGGNVLRKLPAGNLATATAQADPDAEAAREYYEIMALYTIAQAI